MVTLKFSRTALWGKVHCLSVSELCTFPHVFSRTKRTIVFPNSEAVSRPKVFNNPEKTLIRSFIILVITSFFRYNIKPQLQTGNKLLTAAPTLYDKIGEIM